VAQDKEVGGEGGGKQEGEIQGEFGIVDWLTSGRLHTRARSPARVRSRAHTGLSLSRSRDFGNMGSKEEYA
jgi:hypothetical protein